VIFESPVVILDLLKLGGRWSAPWESAEIRPEPRISSGAVVLAAGGCGDSFRCHYLRA
jgi:hypothetical protein